MEILIELDHEETRVRLAGKNPACYAEMMNVKILVRGDENAENPMSEARHVRIEFTSNHDYFWLYTHKKDLNT